MIDDEQLAQAVPASSEPWSESDFLADLEKACRKVDASIAKGVPHQSELRIIPKLKRLDELLSKHKRPFSGRRSFNRVSQYALSLIRHAGARLTPKMRASIIDMAARHPGVDVALRHTPERPIDILLDAYEAKVVARGFGSPRRKASKTKLNRTATAEDVPCDLDEITELAWRRIQHINTLVPAPEDAGEDREHRLVNPAASDLIRKGARLYGEGWPEDPLRPGFIDQITVAGDCGIAMKDLRFSARNRELLDELRGDAPLIANPLIALRRYTYATLLDAGLEMRNDQLDGQHSQARLARRTSAALADFLTLPKLGGRLSDVVPFDFPDRVEKAIAAGPSKFGSNWKASMRLWIAFDTAHRATLPLPDSVGLTLRVLLAESGLSIAQAAKRAGMASPVLGAWVRGHATPSHGSEPQLEALAKVLRVPAESLTQSVSDEWRLTTLAIDHPDYHPSMARYIPTGFEKLKPDELGELLRRIKATVLNQNTPSARRQAAQSRDQYRLKKKDWPASLQAAWDHHFPEPVVKEKRKEDEWRIMRPDADDDDPDLPEEIASSDDELREGTRMFRLRLMESMLGYFHRPRQLTEMQLEQARMLDQSMTTDFRPQAGLGIPLEHLSPAMLALPNLISSYIWWRCHRSGVQSPLVLSMLALAATFLKPKKGYVWQHAGKADLLELKKWWDEKPHDLSEGDLKLNVDDYIANWENAVGAAYTKLAKNHRFVRNGKMPFSRDPFLPINSVINSSAPLQKYMIGVHNMLASKPARIIDRHVHLRDCILTLILIQTGLRAAMLMFDYDDKAKPEKITQNAAEEAALDKTEIRIFKAVAEDGRQVWRIRIAAEMFKNYFSSYFQGGRPYECTLRNEDGLYAKIERWVRYARPYLLRGGTSGKFFVTRNATDVTADEVRDIYHRITRYYFVERPALSADDEDDGAERMGIPGMMVHGPHAVRHIIATSIVKSTGAVHLAAWAIQDSYKTVEKHYARFFPRDKVVIAERELEIARERGRAAAEAAARAAGEARAAERTKEVRRALLAAAGV